MNFFAMKSIGIVSLILLFLTIVLLTRSILLQYLLIVSKFKKSEIKKLKERSFFDSLSLEQRNTILKVQKSWKWTWGSVIIYFLFIAASITYLTLSVENYKNDIKTREEKVK